MPRALEFGILALALAGSGCSLAPDTPPSAEVMSVRLTGISLTQQQLAVTLCIMNPNPNELAFRRVTADLDVSGAPFAAGASDTAVRLPPSSSTAVPFTVVTTVQNLGAQVLGIMQSQGVDYRVRGAVTLEGALGLTLPYSRSGHLGLIGGALSFASAAPDATSPRCRSASRERPIPDLDHQHDRADEQPGFNNQWRRA